MTKQEYLLSCLVEECAEVIQRATKIQRFGIDEKQPEQPLDNRGRLAIEFYDLMAIIEILQDNKILPADIPQEFIDAKQAKIAKFMDYSVECGTLI